MLHIKIDIKKVKQSVPELLFYHLENQPLGQVLPTLLEKTLNRGWRATVECGNDDVLEQVDTQLWTFRDDSFLPHAAQQTEANAITPILLTRGAENENNSNVRFFVGGARPRDEQTYQRLVYLFDGHNTEYVENARADWRQLKEQFEVTYWQQSQSGRWEKKA